MDCSFIRRAVNCMWANEENADPAWQIGTVPLSGQKFVSLTGTQEMPGNKSLFISVITA